MKRTFKRGGVHPPQEKHFTREKPIENPPLPERVFIPLNQNLGAPSKSVVEPKQEVKTGQIIAEPTGFVSSPVHASVSGVVKSIGYRRTSVSPCSLCIEIESDGKDAWVDGVQLDADAIDFSHRESFLESIRAAGLVGMGGAAFPTHVKLSPPKEFPVDTLIVNGVECEPYLTADNRLMLEHPGEILQGLLAMKAVLGVERAFIGIEDNKPRAIAAVREAVGKTPGVEVVTLKTRYPQGAEKQLIKAVLGREVPPGKLPMQVGAVVQNVGTAFAVFEAVARRKPLVERVLTVSGQAIREPKNLRVRIGTPLKNIVEYCGGARDNLGKLIMGGPMMGKALRSADVPVLKSTSGLVFLDKASSLSPPECGCIRCGRCVLACPQGLVPGELARLSEAGAFERLADALDCVECGSCQYACPSNRRILHLLRLGKNEYRNLQKEKQTA
jgi:electron transport complex protein RnfC